MRIVPFALEPPLSQALIQFDSYAKYPFLDEAKRLNLLRDRLSAAAQAEHAVCLASEENGTYTGVIAVKRFPWGESHFKVGMAHIEIFTVVQGPMAQEARERLFNTALQWIKDHRIQHLAIRLDAADQSTIHFLEANGFRLMDTLTTFIYNTHRHRKVPTARRLFPVRDYRPEDRDPVLALAATSFRETRFSHDPFLPKAGLPSFYEDWGNRLCRGETADRLLVAVNRHQEVVGFLGYKLDHQLQASTGVISRGGGLGAIHPKAMGAYLALLHEAFTVDHTRTDYAELDAQAQNFAVIRIWNKLKCQQVRIRHTFHAWLET